ncbi:hypothetical protein TNCT_606851 [Trichonephila clavata]|uniref:Uncharacterized protein n=1 Tax=Trichonephila clavata TaxID=2740835 RepID=A0A8X6GHZ2_TRICU|nr:hypothetical protein TNCT_606851 [Trichonephila clavata]
MDKSFTIELFTLFSNWQGTPHSFPIFKKQTTPRRTPVYKCRFCPKHSLKDFFAVGNAKWRGEASGGKAFGGSKLRNKTGVIHLRAVV